MTNFNNKAVSEAAYYIWKNAGCPANSHSADWSAAMNQLSAAAAPRKIAARKVMATAAIKVAPAKSNTTKTTAAKKSK